MSALADRIVAARGRLGLGQRELAERVGLSQPTLSRIEKHDRAVKANELASLAWALGLTISELTGSSPVRDRAVCVARATGDSDMEAMRAELLHYLELDALLEDQGIPAAHI